MLVIILDIVGQIAQLEVSLMKNTAYHEVTQVQSPFWPHSFLRFGHENISVAELILQLIKEGTLSLIAEGCAPNVRFLISDNGISQIFSISFNT